MRLWLRKLFGLDDRNLNPAMPWGRCEASWRVRGPIPFVICGKRTNSRYGDHWACSEHMVPYEAQVHNG